jgi:phosphoserine / homoserine phosphotransferase
MSKVGDGGTGGQFHDEVGPLGVGGAGVEDLRDVGMIHQRQGLAFGLEPGDDLPGVHAQLDDLRGDFAADATKSEHWTPAAQFEKLRPVKQSIVTLDMEGVLTPEIWIAVAEKTGIKELRRTTRDEPDYDKLMRGRLKILDQHHLKLSDIQQVIGTLRPLEGAKEFLEELRSRVQVIILSDTFEQFAAPLLRQLSWPTLLCHRLVVEHDRIVDYKLRVPEQKQKAVAALKLLNYYVISGGDSFNDTAMLTEAHVGFLFRAPENVKKQFPQFKAVEAYSDFMKLIKCAMAG